MTNFISLLRNTVILIFTVTVIHLFSIAHAGSILIWPIHPVIKEGQHSTVIWLENKDSQTAFLHIRAMRWQQANGQDSYERQSEVTVSPPFAIIAPGKRQLVRLVSNSTLSAGKEKAYRIFVDEAPRTQKTASTDETNNDSAQSNVNIRMRYAIPLFVYSDAGLTQPDNRYSRDKSSTAASKLSYRLNHQDGQTFIEIKNEGLLHARIAQLSNHSGHVLVDGLIGYVLPKTTINLPLPKGINYHSAGQLQAQINNASQLVSLAQH